MIQSQNLADLFLRRLDSIHALDQDDRDAVNRLPLQITEIKADQDIVREGDRPSRSCIHCGARDK